MADLVGVTRHVVDSLIADRTLVFRRLPESKQRAVSGGQMMSGRPPRNVIVINREQAPFAAHYDGPPIEPGYRFVVTPQLRSSVSLPRGKERDREGT